MDASTPASTTTRRPRVVLATAQLLPDGETGGELLLTALDRVGIDASWVCWDDDAVDWACDLVVVRSTWDYHRRPEEFLAWARRVERIAPLLNGADTFAWNADKRYLLDLAPLVPVVPTALLDEADLVAGLRAALERHGPVVVKPRVGAGGNGLVVLDSMQDPRLEALTTGPWVVQPVVTSVHTTGETSVYVLDGRAVSQVDKRPAPGGARSAEAAGGSGGEIRVHEHHGGTSRAVDLAAPTAGLAQAAVRAAGHLLGRAPAYARVDMMVVDGSWAVSELELIEPGLYLDVVPENARHLADLVAQRVRATG